jgi:hypothetical protein
MEKKMRSQDKKYSVVWQGITFVTFSARPRATIKVVELDRVYALCPGNKVAVTNLSGLFPMDATPTPSSYSSLPEALRRLGLIGEDVENDMRTSLTKNTEREERRRSARDLMDSLEYLKIDASSQQEKIIREFYPDFGFKS